MHKGHRQRLKKRFLEEGLGSFQDHEVLELLLFYAIPQGDTNELAHTLLDRFSSLLGVFGASKEDLCGVKGVKEHTAVFIKAIPAFTQFYSSLLIREKKVLTSSYDAGIYVSAMIGSLQKEVFAVICLDAQRRVLAFEKIEEGTVSGASVSPRKVAEYVIRHNAASIILAHNHPSGTLCASENDRRLTSKLCDIFENMDIPVIDHIIAVPGGKFLSMCDSSLMPN